MIQESYPAWPGGEWKTVKLIGRGSFGAVYEIEREVFGHIEKAALKLITIPQSSSDIDELLSDGYDEESITLRLEGYLKDIVREYSMMVDMKGCANIVYCDDVKYIQHDDGMGWDIFIKMELLTALPKALGKTMSDEQIVRIGADICSALAFCEKRSLLHRDIKPQNIFVATDGTYKLGDFGIAKTAERTTSGTKTGTYKYMAPEVYNNQPYGGKADIYSLGLVMYWLLNERRTPFLPLPPTTPTSTDEDKARARRFRGEPLPPPAHGSEELKRIVLKACAYDPKDRYASAEEMLRDLEKLKDKLSDIPPDPAPKLGLDTGLTDDGPTHGAFGHEHPEQPSKDDAIKRQLHSAYEAACDQEAHAQTARDFYAAAAAFEQSFLQGYLDSADRAGKCRDRAEQLQGKTDPVLDEQPEKHAGVRKKKRNVIAALAGLAAVAVIALVLWGVFPQITRGDPENRDSSLSAHTAVPVQTQSPTTSHTPVPTSEPAVVSTPTQTPDPTPTPTDTLPIQPDWTEWLDQLPAYVTAENYDLEERTLYSSRRLETTSSTKSSKMDGWELYDTATGAGAYGAWSDWSQTAAAKSDTRDVETQTRYRYSDRETTTSNDDSMSGWILEDTQYSYGEYGSWSVWSENEVTESETRQVEKKTQYRARAITISSEYSDWGPWSDWTLNEISETPTIQVDSQVDGYLYNAHTITCAKCGWHCNRYAVNCVAHASQVHENGEQNEAIELLFNTVRGKTEWDGNPATLSQYTNGYFYAQYSTITLNSYGLTAGNTADPEQSGSDQYTIDSYVGPMMRYRSRSRDLLVNRTYSDWSDYQDSIIVPNETTEVATRVVYRFRDRSIIPQYSYYRWTDWSDWAETSYTQTNTRKVETATFYRFRDRVMQTTYYFRRWSDWSDYSKNPVEKSDTTEVQTKKQYRYKSRNT